MRLIALMILASLLASPTAAQELESHQLLGPATTRIDFVYRDEKNRRWVEDFKAWSEELGTKWWNYYGYYAPNNKFVVLKHRPAPPPPIWLLTDCAGIPEGESNAVCKMFAQWQGLATRTQTDRKPSNNRYLMEFQTDLMFSDTRYGSQVRGPIGLHLAFIPDGNFQRRTKIFAAPGFMLICLDGTSKCEPATTLGFGVRLWDFPTPLSRKPLSLHLSFIRAWTWVEPGSLSMIGISFTTSKGR